MKVFQTINVLFINLESLCQPIFAKKTMVIFDNIIMITLKIERRSPD